MIQSSFLFVYGTLRRGNGNAMFRLLAECADFVDLATYQGKLFLIDDYPGVIASAYPDDLVHGEVYKLHQPDSLLPILDRYEECAPEFPQPAEYLRKIQPVQLHTGEKLSAWVYLYNKSADTLQQLYTGDFLKSEKY